MMRQAIAFTLAVGLLIAGSYLIYLEVFFARVMVGLLRQRKEPSNDC
jgi:hypothetical protein